MKYNLLLITTVITIVGCAVLTKDEVSEHKSNYAYITMLKEYIQKDADMNPAIRDAHMFTIDQWEHVITDGLARGGVRETHKVNAEIYLPKLVKYIEADESRNEEQKNKLVDGVNKWLEYIRSQIKEEE